MGSKGCMAMGYGGKQCQFLEHNKKCDFESQHVEVKRHFMVKHVGKPQAKVRWVEN